MNFIPINPNSSDDDSDDMLSSSANLTIEMNEARNKLQFLEKNREHRSLEKMKKKAYLTLNMDEIPSRPSVKSVSSSEEVHFDFEKKINKPVVYPMAISLIRKSMSKNPSLIIDKLDLTPLSPRLLTKQKIIEAEEYWRIQRDVVCLRNAERVSKIKKISIEILSKMNTLYSKNYLKEEAYEDLKRIKYIPNGELVYSKNITINEDKFSKVKPKSTVFRKGITVKNIYSYLDKNLPGNIETYGQDIVHVESIDLSPNSNVTEIELRDGHGSIHLGANIAALSIQALLKKRQEDKSRLDILENVRKGYLEYAKHKIIEDYRYIQDILLKEIPKSGAGSTSVSCQFFNVENRKRVGVFANIGDSEIIALVFKPGKIKSKILMLSEAHNPENEKEAQRIYDLLGKNKFIKHANPIYARGGVHYLQYYNVLEELNRNRVRKHNDSNWLTNDKVPLYDIVNNKVVKNLERAYAFSTGIKKFAVKNGCDPNLCAGIQGLRKSTLLSERDGKIVATGQLSIHLGENFAATLNGSSQCTRSFHDVKEHFRGSIAVPYCSVYEFEPDDHVVIIASSDGFSDILYVSEIAKVVEEIYHKNSNMNAEIITNKLWNKMIDRAKEAGMSFKNNIASWDDISLAVIDSEPLI